MDSGASITAFGSESETFMNNPKYKIRNFPSLIKTANGQQERVFGYIWMKISFNGVQHSMRIHLIPGLKQKLYLGMDFWKLFGIELKTISELDNIPPRSNSDHDPNRHVLSDAQELELSNIIKEFPSFANLGLGKTSLLSHHIDVGNAVPVKQRYYPLSPPKQAELYAEIERMLSLKVIEESTSSWSSPVTLVQRANGKVRLCLDARRLNEVTVKDAYPLPIIDAPGDSTSVTGSGFRLPR